MIFDRIMLPAQGRSEDYKFAQAGSVTLAASVGGAGGGASTPSWLENVIKLDPESGYLSVDNWHVKGDLIIEGQVNQWLAQQLVVDDARIQVNRKQESAVVDSGLVIFDKDSSTEVSSLVYDVTGVWKAGGDRLFTEAYNPKLGGYPAASYPRKAENAVITGWWNFQGPSPRLYIEDTTQQKRVGFANESNRLLLSRYAYDSGTHQATLLNISIDAPTNSFRIEANGNVGLGVAPTERLHVAGNGLFTGNLTAGGNVGTSDFVSQMQGWRVTPQGQADFRHIFTDELQAKAFTADISQALVGSDVLTKSVAKLAQNFKIGANNTYAYLYVEELEGYPGMSVFSKWDKLRLRVFDRTGGGLVIADVWVTVTDHDINDTVNNVQRYSVRFDDDGGVVGLDVYAGSMVLDYGQSGSGVIERTVLDPQGSPYSRVSTWTGSPDNPANYTLHYQSGNLNGIPNAEGWGVYSENSFLTGKLLVGDLTKAGQYMEYKDGVLNIKGQITVTGGNAATKADIDALQIGSRNLLKNSDFSNGLSGWHDVYATIVQHPDYGNVCKIESTQIATGLRLPLEASFIKEGVLYTFSALVRADVPTQIGIAIDGSGISAAEIYTAGDDWSVIKITKVAAANRNPRVYTASALGGTFYIAWVKLELGTKATDWTPAPEDVPSALDYLATAIQDGSTEIEGGLINTNVLMVKDTAGDVVGGMSGLKSDNIGFWTGGTYQAAVDNNANVIFRKDGSFSLAGGKITGTSAGALSVDGGIITGVIQSENWDGTQGSKFNLLDGSLEFGNTIKVDSFAKEIIVTDRDTQNTGVRIGDFLLSPTTGGAGALDVDLSGSRTLPAFPAYSPQDPPFLLRYDLMTYINSSGVLGGSSVTVSTSLTAGNNYTFQTNIKARITRGDVLDTATDPIGAPLTVINSFSPGGVSPRIRVTLFSGDIEVGRRSFTIPTVSDIGVSTYYDLPLNVNIPFVAASTNLRVEITQYGEVKWKVRYPASQGSLVEYRNAGLIYSEVDASSRVRIIPSAAITELSAKGFLSLWGPSKYFRIYDRAGISNFIEARGVQEFISPNGTYRLRITDSGIQKSTNGGISWTSL